MKISEIVGVALILVICCLLVGLSANFGRASTDPRVAGSFNSWSTTADPMTYVATWGGLAVYERTRSLTGSTEIQYKIYVDDWGDKWWGRDGAPGYYLPQVCQIYNNNGNIYALPPATDNYVFQFRTNGEKWVVLKRKTVQVPGSFNSWNVNDNNMTYIGDNVWRSSTYSVTGPKVENFKFIMGNTYDFYYWGWEYTGTPQDMPHSGTAYRGPNWGTSPYNIKVNFSASTTENFRIRFNSETREYWVDDLTAPAAPTLISPADGENTTDTTPILGWSAVADHSWPVTYQLLVDNNSDFSSPEVDSGWIGAIEYTLPELSPGEYYWRVRARDYAGNIGGWSTVRTFSVVAGGIIRGAFVDKARYNPGENATITIECLNRTGANWSGTLYLDIYHLENLVYSDNLPLTLLAGESSTKTFIWTTLNEDFKGYHVWVRAGTTDNAATAIDVSSTWTKYPRYGFLSLYQQGENADESQAKINKLSQDYHINALQFYDWMWRHENFIKRASNGTIENTWTDWDNYIISWNTILNLINASHNLNVATMPYVQIYGALENYEEISKVNPQWGIYTDNQHQNQFYFDLGENQRLYIFNPGNTNWQNHLFSKAEDAIKSAGFDGVHVDQIGDRYNVYDYWGNPIVVDGDEFVSFLNNLKEHVQAVDNHLVDGNGTKNTVTFNVVDPFPSTAKYVAEDATLNFIYSEIWNTNTYIGIKDWITELKKLSGLKPIVLAAYVNYYDETGLRYEAENALLQGCKENNYESGYTGRGYVDNFGEEGDNIIWTVYVPEDGRYSLVFRYAHDTGYTVTKSIYVDGQKIYVNAKNETQIKFKDRDNWSDWSTGAFCGVILETGEHTIRLTGDPGDVGLVNIDALILGTFDEDSVRLADAAFAATGAFHIEMGDNDQMVSHEYFRAESKQMRDSLEAAMRDYCTFITAYQNLLFNNDVIDGDSGTQFVKITGETTSGSGSDNTIWTNIKRNDNYEIIHLINLCNNDDEWRNEANTPPTKTNLAVKYYTGPDISISGVYVATPDENHGKTLPLDYTTGKDENGNYASFTMPYLKYWTMVYIRRSFTPPENNRYEAENAVLTNVGTNTNHAGYTGSGFVDQFETQNDGVSFLVYADTTDDYCLAFRYANDTGSTATRSVYVDGHYRGRVYMKDLANWDTWDYGILTTRLTKGLHSIVFWYTSDDAQAINLDHLELRKAYVWSFNVKIDRIPDNYYITFRVGCGGDVRWGTNNWNNVTDTALVKNGLSSGENWETTIDPFTGTTEVNFTFHWDTDGDGTPDTWEGEDWSIGTNAPLPTWPGDRITSYYPVEGVTGNNYSFAQFDARGTLFDFMSPLGIWSGMVLDGNQPQLNIYKSTAGIKLGENYYWLNDPAHWTYSQSYVTDTATIKTVATHKVEPVEVTAYAFAPENIVFPNDNTSGNPIRGMLIQRFFVKNTGPSSLNATFMYYQDMNINGLNEYDNIEYKSAENCLFYHDPGDSASGRTRTMDFGLTFNPEPTGHKVYQITDAGYLAENLSLAAGDNQEVAVFLVGASTPSVGQNSYLSHIKPAVEWFKTENMAKIQENTENFWINLLGNITTFESPNDNYNSFFKRSIITTYLFFDAENGGMGAGGYLGNYFSCWPRDAVYGAVTLDRVGIHDIAENVYYWLWNVAERDSTYRFWWQKYTMDGKKMWENPQVDETAVIPWGAWYHYLQTGDSNFIGTYAPLVREAGLVCSQDNPHDGLDYNEDNKLMFSQNSWEDKWGMFLYSNANVWAALRDGALFMENAGDNENRDIFNARKDNFAQGLEGLYNSSTQYFNHAVDVKKNYTQPAIVMIDVSADISMLGIVVPFEFKAADNDCVGRTVKEIEGALTDFSETKMAYGGVCRYRADQEERYGENYRDLGDTYYDGGPWMMPTLWMSEYYLENADTKTGKTDIDKAENYLKYVISYLGNLGIGAEQIDETKYHDEFALETAWPNVWESNGKIIDTLMAFIDHRYNAVENTLKISPKLPSDWCFLGSNIRLKDGKFYIKENIASSTQILVDWSNNTSTDLSMEIYIQTDSSPTSITGTSLNWTYNSTTGRVKFYGVLSASASENVTINL